jgi:ABC-type glycerol-3-phosphate transport system permease component
MQRRRRDALVGLAVATHGRVGGQAFDLHAAPLEHYQALFSGGNSVGPYIRNSLIAAGVSTIIAVVLGCLAGYGLARSRFRGKDHVAFWIISQRMAPSSCRCS